MTVIHLEAEQAFQSWMQIDYLLKEWMDEIPPELEKAAYRLERAWEAQAAGDVAAAIRGVALAQQRHLAEAMKLHNRLHHEYREWIDADRGGMWIVEELDKIFPFSETLDKLRDFTEDVAEWGEILFERGASSAGLGGLLGLQIASHAKILERAKRFKVRTFKEAIQDIGMVDVLFEVIEEVPENWDQSGGDPLRFGVSVVVETVVGLVISAGMSTAGAEIGAMIGGAIGGPVGGVIGAAVGTAFSQFVLPHLKVGNVEVEEWLESIEDVASGVAVGHTMAEHPIARQIEAAASGVAQKGLHYAKEAIDKVAGFFHRRR